MHEKGSNLPLIKKRNYQLVKKMIYLRSPISRSEIAHDLNLTAPTITACVTPLLAQGLVQESEALPSDEGRQLGRRPTMLEFVSDAFCLCGMELGAYHTHIVLTDLLGNILHSDRCERVPPNYQTALSFMEQAFRSSLRKSGTAKSKILGLGIALPGPVASGSPIRSLHNPTWNGRDLEGDFSSRIGLPVVIENNVRARAFSAHLFDRCIEADPAVYFFSSFGLACPVIIDGKVIYGLSSAAGEIGHTVVDPNGPVCHVCGKKGCLEAIASEQAVLRRCRALIDNGASTILRQLCPDSAALTIDNVLSAQNCEDPAVIAIISDSIQYLATFLASIINLVSPRTILIDAQLMSLTQNRELMLSEVRKNAFEPAVKDTDIRFIPYDPMGGARGAAAMVVKNFLLENPD